MEYKIIEKGEDIKDAQIEKRGHVITFTMREVEAHVSQLKKLFTEVTAKAAVEKAKMTNVENYHPFVLKMSDEDLSTIHTYMTAKMMFEVASGKAEEIEKQLKEYEVETADILKQIPELEVVPETPVEVTPEVVETTEEVKVEEKVEA